ncbi:Uncharacterised protein [Candidatus Bilamarchaeum dharawalense]|uniref:Uncharacterized protein n=1 Tax=Candidatus Bilamarchaeum dharawalense TaxID=2885759 RepID=A0A5E4LMX9_9ARCH|nr:Uncharacterised protein [Candidatus Bilamarchaeum dharawalense]
MADTKQVTIRGEYLESKAGPLVDGVILINEVYDEKLRGKIVEVTGVISNEHEYKPEPYEKGKPISQGFDIPVMREITSIKVIGKK